MYVLDGVVSFVSYTVVMSMCYLFKLMLFTCSMSMFVSLVLFVVALVWELFV